MMTVYPGFSNCNFLEKSLIETFDQHCRQKNRKTSMLVLSSDELLDLKDRVTDKFYSIVNLSRKGELGSHFVAIILLDNKLFFLDPLAQYIHLNADIFTFIKAFPNKELFTLQRPVQSVHSNKCALFSLFFLYLFSPACSDMRFRKFHRENLAVNDCIVMHNLAVIFEQMRGE